MSGLKKWYIFGDIMHLTTLYFIYFFIITIQGRHYSSTRVGNTQAYQSNVPVSLLDLFLGSRQSYQTI